MSGAEVKNMRSYTSIAPYIFMVWSLIKHSDNSTGFLSKQLFKRNQIPQDSAAKHTCLFTILYISSTKFVHFCIFHSK
jgi:hypothetical protein